MLSLLVRWFLNAAALMLVGYVYSGVSINSLGTALLAAVVLGLVNAIVRPVLVLISLPVTIVTLGLFIFVINALMFWLAATLVDGFNVAGFGAALVGSLLYSLVTIVTSWIFFGSGKK